MTHVKNATMYCNKKIFLVAYLGPKTVGTKILPSPVMTTTRPVWKVYGRCPFWMNDAMFLCRARGRLTCSVLVYSALFWSPTMTSSLHCVPHKMPLRFKGPRADAGSARVKAMMSIDGTEINRGPNCLPVGLRGNGSIVDLCIE